MHPQPHHPTDGRFGVILNANAGRVTRALARRVRRTVGEDRVFLTTSQEHANQALLTCIERGYKTVFAGGGDGTIVDTINSLERLRPDLSTALPAVGVLRLGTGNALAHWLGAGWPVRDLQRFHSGALHSRRSIRMVESEGTLFPFGGLGHDGAVLNDYYELKKKYEGTALAGLMSGLSGYFIAGLGVTVPRFLRRDNTRIRVVNLGGEAWRIGPGGDRVGKPVGHGETLYEGLASTVGAATTPLLGYGFRFFPFAARVPDRLHLRVLDFSPLRCVKEIPAAWNGTMQGEGVHDFYAERVRVQFEQSMPYQMGGDPKGYRDQVSFGLSEHPVTLVGQA
jgi:diacylglycerol kinase family enzyme